MRRSCRSRVLQVMGSLGVTIGLPSSVALNSPMRFSPGSILDELYPLAVPTSVSTPVSTSVSPTALPTALPPALYGADVRSPNCNVSRPKPDFLVFGGGGAPSYNEIAIEKNVRYFQRTLKALKLGQRLPQIYFANGNDGQKTVRFIDPKTQKQRFKPPTIPGVLGPATEPNLRAAIAKTAESPQMPLFFYFTGHGNRNRRNVNNNTMILWHEVEMTVQNFARQLDRLPPAKPVVTVMVQCFSGAFANLIYEQGDPQRPVALQTRCGFFATIKQRPSVGCTPLVNEADYEDYSSSFFAGLSGVNRVGKPVASADYNNDGRVSYREAHAFAKVDEQASDLPISTSEAWLRDRLARPAIDVTMATAITEVLQTARPEQKYVVETIAAKFDLDPAQSFWQNVDAIPVTTRQDELAKTFLTRLQLELINIAAEQQVRQGQDKSAIAILDRILKCESGSWQ